MTLHNTATFKCGRLFLEGPVATYRIADLLYWRIRVSDNADPKLVSQLQKGWEDNVTI